MKGNIHLSVKSTVARSDDTPRNFEVCHSKGDTGVYIKVPTPFGTTDEMQMELRY